MGLFIDPIPSSLCFLQNMNLKIVYLIFHDALFVLFDLHELCASQICNFDKTLKIRVIN